MSVKYKIDIIAKLKDMGYSTYKIRKDKLLSESTLQKFRNGEIVSWKDIEKVCELLGCQIGDLVEYVKE